ncbi:hypothetical protein C0J52_22935 [Blattella germanica]|nr:hypothetical protein C0J52_22935 [Blattella germanica]
MWRTVNFLSSFVYLQAIKLFVRKRLRFDSGLNLIFTCDETLSQIAQSVPNKPVPLMIMNKNEEERARKRLKFVPETKKVKQSAKNVTQQKHNIEEEDDSEDESDAECLYCNYLGLYSCSTEGWVACTSSHNWAPTSCAGIDSEDGEAQHICANCVDRDKVKEYGKPRYLGTFYGTRFHFISVCELTRAGAGRGAQRGMLDRPTENLGLNEQCKYRM